MGKKNKKKKNKIGVNDPCPCGSGKKYKKCHQNREYTQQQNPKAPPEVIETANRFRKPPIEPFEKGGSLLGRPFIDTLYKDKRARAVGNAIYFRPTTETFHEFILDLFGSAIGYDWIAKERAKEKKDRHQLSLWGQEMVENIKIKKREMNGRPFGIKQTGNMKTLLALAYDYYSLCHCSAKIQPNFIKRIKKKDHFQGAKYEMAVAGISVRAGFDIIWINKKSKHCEFIGKHKRTGDEIYFECKSHHRQGVLGKEGEFNPEETKVKVLDHFNQAIEQTDNKLPLVIFNDINLPITPNIELEEKTWMKQVEEVFKKYEFHKKYKETNYGALFITNFSWHFHKNLSELKQNEVIGYFHINGKYSLTPECVSLLKIASEQYGFVPAKLDEFKKF